MHTTRIGLRGALGALLTLLLALAGVLLVAPPAHAAPADDIHALVNQARAANGQPGLLRNPAMDRVAADWAQQLAASGVLAHNPAYSAQIPGGWVRAGENVAQGQATGAAMHDAWMSSAGHRANILGDFTDVGIAFLAAGGTTWGVEVFASYPGHVGPAAPAAPPAEPPAAQAPSAQAPAAPPPPTAETPAESAPTGPAPKASRSTPTAPDAAPAPEATEHAPRTSTPPPRAAAESRGTPPDAGGSPTLARSGPTGPGPWPWIGGGGALLALAAAALVVLRGRGLIGPPSGRHSDT